MRYKKLIFLFLSFLAVSFFFASCIRKYSIEDPFICKIGQTKQQAKTTIEERNGVIKEEDDNFINVSLYDNNDVLNSIHIHFGENGTIENITVWSDTDFENLHKNYSEAIISFLENKYGELDKWVLYSDKDGSELLTRTGEYQGKIVTVYTHILKFKKITTGESHFSISSEKHWEEQLNRLNVQYNYREDDIEKIISRLKQ